MSTDPTTPNDAPGATTPTGFSRRGIVAAAAWSVPVIAVASATPAHATSANSSLSVDVVQVTVAAGGTSQVTATVLDSQGRPWAGQPLTFTINTANGVTFANATGVTNAAGQYSTTISTTTTAAPGVRTVTATSDGFTATDTFTILNTNVVGAGNNLNGQLGDGTTTQRNTAVYTARVFPSWVAQTSSSYNETVYLLENGTVWQSGVLGGSTPTQVAGLSGVTQIATGTGFSLALLSTGEVRAWGANDYGKLGDGTTTARSTPVAVRVSAGGAALTGVTQIATGGDHSLAILNTGEVRAWGLNSVGQLGNGTLANSSVPVTVRAVGGAAGTALTGVSRIAGGWMSSLTVLTNGQGRAWGQAATLGNGTTTASSSPVAIRNTANTANLSGIVDIGAADVSAIALLSDGGVLAWGGESAGNLGNGPAIGTVMYPSPVLVSGGAALTGIVEISASAYHRLARRANGTVVGWGANNGGQLGTGVTGTEPYAVTFVLPTGRTVRALPNNMMTRYTGGTADGTSSVILTP